jgi:tripartite-type tricarboxylate transporter receptor subunit TctC
MRPIRLVVPYPAGGPADTLARFLAPGLTERLGRHECEMQSDAQYFR